MESFKDICDMSLIVKQPVGEEEFQGGGHFKSMVAPSTFEVFCREKCDGFGE